MQNFRHSIINFVGINYNERNLVVCINNYNANTLVDWAKEYGLDSHYPDVHLNRPLSIWSRIEHINILGMHIAVID